MSNAEQGINRGKDFEQLIRKTFEELPDTSVVRLPDPTMGYLGIRNICDFIVYHYPYQYFIECKSVHSHRLPFLNITFNQWQGMLEESKKFGVVAGVICWFVSEDKTVFFPIQNLERRKQAGKKSINLKEEWDKEWVEIKGTKKRIFFNYDLKEFIVYSFKQGLGEKDYEI